MSTYLGIVSIVIGVLWALPQVTGLFKSLPAPVTPSQDSRMDLFQAYVRLHDHIGLVGTPEQKSAMVVVLSAVVSADPRLDASEQ
jgi:hypothetical protein